MTRSSLERNGEDSKELVVAAGVILDNPTVVDISSTVVVEGMMCYAEVKTNRVVVSGRFHGSVHASSLEVSKGGWFAGRAFVRTATVAGRLEGVLVASDALMVRSAGHCKGTIRYGELNVQHGSKLTGSVKAKSLVEEGIGTRQMPEVPSAWNREVSVGDGIRHSRLISSRIFGGKQSTRSNFRPGAHVQRSNSSTRASTRESSRRPAVTDPPPCASSAMGRTDRARSMERGVVCPSRDTPDVPVEGGVRAGTGGGGGIDPVGSGGWGALRDPPAVDGASPGASELDMLDFLQEPGERRVKEEYFEGVAEEELKDGARRYEGRVQSGSQAQGRGVVGAPADPVIVVVAPTHPEAVANDTSPMSTSGAGSCDAVAPPEETTRGPRSNGAEVRSGDAKGEDPGGSGHQFSPKEDRSSQGRGRARAHAVAVAVAATVAVNGDDDQSRAERDRVINEERQRLRKENHARRMLKRRAAEEAQQIRAMTRGVSESSNRSSRTAAAGGSPRDASSAPAPSLAPRASPRRPNLKLGSGEERSPSGLHSPFRARFRSVVASESPIPRRPKIAVPTVLPQWISNDSSTLGEVESGTAPGSGSSAFPAPSPSGGGTEAEVIGGRGHEKGEGEAFPVRGGVSPSTSWERVVTPTSKDRLQSAQHEEEIRLIPAFGTGATSSVDKKPVTAVEAAAGEPGSNAGLRTDSKGVRVDGANGRRTKGESSPARGVDPGAVDARAPERAKASSPAGVSGASGAHRKRGDRKHRSSRKSGGYDGEVKRAAAAGSGDKRADKKGEGATDGKRISPPSTPRSADRSKLRSSPSRVSRGVPVGGSSTPRSPRVTSPRAAPVSPASQAADGAVAAAKQAVKSAKEVERRTKGGHNGRDGATNTPLSQHEKRDVASSHVSPVRSRTSFKHAASTKPASRTGSGSSSSNSSLLGTAPVSPIVSSERSVERLAEQSSRVATVVAASAPQRYSRRGSCRSQGSDLRSGVSVRSDDSRASGSKAVGVRSSPTIPRSASDPPLCGSRTSGRRSRHAGAGGGEGGTMAGSSGHSHSHVPRVRRDDVVQDMDENESFEERRERWLAPFTPALARERQGSAPLSCRRVADRKDVSSGSSAHGSGSTSSFGASRRERGSTSSDGLAGSISASDRRGSASSLSSSGTPWAAPTESTMKKYPSAGVTRAGTASHASTSTRSSSANGRRSRTSTERTRHMAAAAARRAAAEKAVFDRDAAAAKAEEAARIAEEAARRAEELRRTADELAEKKAAEAAALAVAVRKAAAKKEAAARADAIAAKAAVLAEEKANARKYAARRTALAKVTGDAKGTADVERSADPATGDAASAKSRAENSVTASDIHERRPISQHIDVTNGCGLPSLADRAMYLGIAGSADASDAQVPAGDVPARSLRVAKHVATEVRTSSSFDIEAFGAKSDSIQELKAGEAPRGVEPKREGGNRVAKPSVETLPITVASSVELPAPPVAVVTSVAAAEEGVAVAAAPGSPETHVSLAAEKGVEDGFAIEASGESVAEKTVAGAGKLVTTKEAARAPETAPEIEENADEVGAQVKSTAVLGASNAAVGKETSDAKGGDEFDGVVDEVVDEVGDDTPESPGTADPAQGKSDESQAATVRLSVVSQDKEEKAVGENTDGEVAKITGDAEEAKPSETVAQQSPKVRPQAGENSGGAGLPAKSNLFATEGARRKSAPLRGATGVDLSKGVALLRRPINRAQPGDTGDAPGSALGLLRHPGASSSPTRPPTDLPPWPGRLNASMGDKGMPRVESEPGMLASAGVASRPRMVAGQHMKDRSVFKDPEEVKQGLGPAGAFASKATWRLDFQREKRESAAAAKSDGQGGFHNPMAGLRGQQNNSRARRASDAPKGSSPLGIKLQDSSSGMSSMGADGDAGGTPASSPLAVPAWVMARGPIGGALRSPNGMLRTRTAQGRLGSSTPSEASSTSPLLTSAAAAGRSRRPEEVMTTAAIAAGVDALSKSDDENDAEEVGLSATAAATATVTAAVFKGGESSKEDTPGACSVSGGKPEGRDADEQAPGKEDGVAIGYGGVGGVGTTENPASSAPEEGPAAGGRFSVDSHDAVDHSPEKNKPSPSEVTDNAGVGVRVENGRRHRLTGQGGPDVVDAGDQGLGEREKEEDGERKGGRAREEADVAVVCSPAAFSSQADDAVGGLVAAELRGGLGGDKSGTKRHSLGTNGAMVQTEVNSMAEEGVGATEEGVTVHGDDPWDGSEASKRSPPGGLAALGRFLFGGPNPPPSRFLPTSASLEDYPIAEGTVCTDVMSEALGIEDDPLGHLTSSSSGTKAESDHAPKIDPETDAPPERAAVEEAGSPGDGDGNDGNDGNDDGGTGRAAGAVVGVRPAGGGDVNQSREEEGDIADAGQNSSAIVVPTVEAGSDGADGKRLGQDQAGESSSEKLEWRVSEGTSVDPRTNPLSASDGSTSNSTERLAPPGSGPEPVRASKSRSRFFASPPKEEGRAPEVTFQADGIRGGGDLASRLELAAGDVQGHAREGDESVETTTAGLPSSPRSGEPVSVTSVIEGTVAEEGSSGPGADRARDAKVEDAGTETPMSLRPRPCSVDNGDASGSPAQTVAGTNWETRDKKDVADRSEARSASKAGDMRVAIAPPSADRGRGTPVNARRILSSASRTEKSRDRSRRIVEASGSASGTGLRSSRLSRSKSPGPRKRGSRPVLVRSPSLLSGERKTGLAALEDQGVANKAARRAILEETKQRRNAESRQRPGIFETLRQRSVGNLEHRESNRRALGGNRRRDEVSPRSERRGSSSTSFSASASPVTSTSGAVRGVSPREEAPIALPALARRRTDGDKLGRVVDSRPLSIPREASEKNSASTAGARKEAESLDKELEVEAEVDENEVEGGDDTEDSEEEPDYWAKYGVIDDSALDEDAEIEI